MNLTTIMYVLCYVTGYVFALWGFGAAIVSMLGVYPVGPPATALLWLSFALAYTGLSDRAARRLERDKP